MIISDKRIYHSHYQFKTLIMGLTNCCMRVEKPIKHIGKVANPHKNEVKLQNMQAVSFKLSAQVNIEALSNVKKGKFDTFVKMQEPKDLALYENHEGYKQHKLDSHKDSASVGSDSHPHKLVRDIMDPNIHNQSNASLSKICSPYLYPQMSRSIEEFSIPEKQPENCEGVQETENTGSINKVLDMLEGSQFPKVIFIPSSLRDCYHNLPVSLTEISEAVPKLLSNIHQEHNLTIFSNLLVTDNVNGDKGCEHNSNSNDFSKNLSIQEIESISWLPSRLKASIQVKKFDSGFEFLPKNHSFSKESNSIKKEFAQKFSPANEHNDSLHVTLESMTNPKAKVTLCRMNLRNIEPSIKSRK
jgi:hypothetical protein